MALVTTIFSSNVYAANNCTGATYYDADSDTCINCPAGYDYNTTAGKSAATQCQTNCAAGKWNGEYTRLEYVHFDGAAYTGAYVDTGLTYSTDIVNTNIKIKADAKVYTGNQWHVIVGSLGQDSAFIGPNYNNYLAYGIGDLDVITNVMNPYTRCLHNFDAVAGTYTVYDTTTNQQVLNVTNMQKTTKSVPLKILMGGYEMSPGTMRDKYRSNMDLYSVQIYDGNTLKFNGIPARRNSDGVIGIYDTVSGTFKTNAAGTNALTAGPDVGGGIGACTDVGTGYYGAGGTTNFGTAITRTQCTGATYCASGVQTSCPTGYDYNTTAGKTAVTQCQANCTTSEWIPTVPSTYTVLEYIESTGTQYIDTGIILNYNSKVAVKALTVSDSNAKQLFGNNLDKQRAFTCNVGNGSIMNSRFGNTKYTGQIYIDDVSPHIYSMDKNGILVDGVLYGYEATPSDFTQSESFYVLKARGNEAPYIMLSGTRLYFVDVYQSNTLIMNLVPARRNSDSVLGMYDTVSGTFFTNAGSGAFVAGPVGGVTCTDVGVGYSSAGGVVNFGSSLSRTPNTITIEWDGANGTYQTGSCTYGGGFNTPATPPTRRGYRFDGWTFVTE